MSKMITNMITISSESTKSSGSKQNYLTPPDEIKYHFDL